MADTEDTAAAAAPALATPSVTENLSVGEAADAFLQKMTDGESPSGVEEVEEREADAEETSPAEAATEDELESDASIQEDEAEGGDDDSDPEAGADEASASETDAEGNEAAPDDAVKADDAHVIEWSVDGETHQATVADLRRLAGQESSLTRRSQSLSEQTQLTANYGAQYRAFLTGRKAELEARVAPFANVDWDAAIRDMPEQAQAVQAVIAAAQQEFAILDADATNFLNTEREFRRRELIAKAPEVQAILQHEIPGWGDARYNELRTYAQGQGLPQTEVDMIIHPGVLKMIDKAKRWDDAMAARGKAKPKPKSRAKTSPKSGRAASRLRPGAPTGTPALDAQAKSAFTHRRNTAETALAFEEQINRERR